MGGASIASLKVPPQRNPLIPAQRDEGGGTDRTGVRGDLIVCMMKDRRESIEAPHYRWWQGDKGAGWRR
ncbi:MAG: hypothetical protein C4294_00715 [Nitrospiraceae bacterium]